MSGAGNLFSVIDNRNYNLNIKQGQILAPILCEKNNLNDFKTEGLMFLENKNDKFDFVCNFFNPDGSTGMMCGNGGRAITRFAELNGMIKNKNNINFFMSNESYHSELIQDEIKLYMPKAKLNPVNKNIQIKEKDIKGYFSNTGTFHYVINTDENNIDFESFDINDLGSKIRHSEDFKPDGTNVNFTKVQGNEVRLRTFEKGVEAETGACGTGAVAVALTYSDFYNFEFPISIIPSSGEKLTIDIVKENNSIQNMILQGPAKVLYEVNINIPDNLFF